MGLFDGYQFDPQNYGGILGNWLRQSMAQPQPGAGAMYSFPPMPGQGGVGPAMPEIPQGDSAPSPAVIQPPPGSSPPGGGGGFLGGFGNALNNNALTLMALGGGIAQGGIGRGLQMAAPFAAHEQTQRKTQESQGATYQALRASGVSHGEAVAAALNPDVLKALVPEYFGSPKVVQTGEGPLGKEFQLQQGRNFSPIPGNVAIGTGGGGGQSLLAPGVRQIDPSITGDAKLEQYSATVQGAVKALQNGDTMPTGNPRQQGLNTFAKSLAQQIAAEGGTPYSDSLYTSKREIRAQLARATPGSSGGQITFAGTSLAHLAEVAEKATHLENVSGFGIAPIARLMNEARGLKTEQAKKVNEVNGSVQHYGQEITKFYTGSPGGVEERQRFMKVMDSAKSPEEIAGAIRAERDLIPGRLDELQAQISNILGPEEATKQLARAKVSEQVEKINKALAKLDPTGPEAKALKGAPAAPQSNAPVVRWERGPDGKPRQVIQQ